MISPSQSKIVNYELLLWRAPVTFPISFYGFSLLKKKLLVVRASILYLEFARWLPKNENIKGDSRLIKFIQKLYWNTPTAPGDPSSICLAESKWQGQPPEVGSQGSWDCQADLTDFPHSPALWNVHPSADAINKKEIICVYFIGKEQITSKECNMEVTWKESDKASCLPSIHSGGKTHQLLTY